MWRAKKLRDAGNTTAISLIFTLSHSCLQIPCQPLSGSGFLPFLFLASLPTQLRVCNAQEQGGPALVPRMTPTLPRPIEVSWAKQFCFLLSFSGKGIWSKAPCGLFLFPWKQHWDFSQNVGLISSLFPHSFWFSEKKSFLVSFLGFSPSNWNLILSQSVMTSIRPKPSFQET